MITPSSVRTTAVLALMVVAAAGATPAIAAPAPGIQYFFGNSETFLPSGRSVGSQPVLVERIVDPAAQRITERVFSPAYKQPGHFNEFVVLMSVDPTAGTLTEKERHGALTGTGTLTGPAWRWTAWHTSSKLPNGMRIESSDHVTSGGMADKKDVFGPDGKLQVTQQETFQTIGADQFEQIYYHWMLQ